MTTCSVCMATFNGEKHIQHQLQSILNQLSADDEIIISDDGSTDQTIQIIRSFGDKRISIVFNESRKGPVGNFENAINHAKGDLIFLCDQDDVWQDTKLQRHIQLHDQFDLVISDAVVTNEVGLVIHPSFFKVRKSKAGLLYNLKKNRYIGCCMSMNRKIIHYALPFPPSIHMHDWWIGLVAELKGKVFFCDDKLIHYVRHDSNASPTLGNSGYSFLRQVRNRVNMAVCLSSVMVKR